MEKLLNTEEIKLEIKKALSGDQKAYENIVNRYKDGLFLMLKKMVYDSIQAEDLVQETFLKAFRALKSYNPEHAFSTWLYKIARNNCIDFIRKKKLQTFSMVVENPIEGFDSGRQREFEDIEAVTPEREIIQKERSNLIQLAIDGLPKKYHEAIVLRHQEDKSYEEIAQLLNVPIGTVKARIFRAREMLKIALKNKIYF